MLATLPCLSAPAPTPFELDDLLSTGNRLRAGVFAGRRSHRLHRLAQRQEERQGDERHLGRALERRRSRAAHAHSQSERVAAALSEATEVAVLSQRCGQGRNHAAVAHVRERRRCAARSRTFPAASAISTFRPTASARSSIAEVGLTVGSKAETPPPIETERFVFKRDGDGYLDDRTQQLFIVDLATGKARQLTSGQRDHWHPAWSPDGKLHRVHRARIAARPIATSTTKSSCRRVDGGEPRKISTFNGADNDPDWGARPSWSPDSRRVLWLEGGEDKWIYYAPFQLAVADLATGEVTRPARIDRWFYYPKFAPDGSIISLIEQDRDTWLARIDAASGKIEYLTFRQAIRQRLRRRAQRPRGPARKRCRHAC